VSGREGPRDLAGKGAEKGERAVAERAGLGFVHVLLMSVRTLAIRLMILALALASALWPKAGSYEEGERLTAGASVRIFHTLHQRNAAPRLLLAASFRVVDSKETTVALESAREETKRAQSVRRRQRGNDGHTYCARGSGLRRGSRWR
jgi:hypothetical protein